MPKKPLSLQKTADRALCPVPTANVMHMKVHEIARWMRGAGVTEALTPQQATAWKVDPRNAPERFTGLLAEHASCAAEREYRERQADLEDEHRMLNLTEKVTQADALAVLELACAAENVQRGQQDRPALRGLVAGELQGGVQHRPCQRSGGVRQLREVEQRQA
ncbi:hypothetical protein [Dactylosporangium darangshiense]|uniref:hypothetical protein n=1 Tax=Dactylosporangium darangshiense TaxID=579108 RepID=UPI0031E8AD8D